MAGHLCLVENRIELEPSEGEVGVTGVARRSGPARHAGAEAYPGPRQAPTAPRPGPSRRPQARPMPVRPNNRPGRIGARGLLAVIIAGRAVVLPPGGHSTPGAPRPPSPATRAGAVAPP